MAKRYWFRATYGRVWHERDTARTEGSTFVYSVCNQLFVPRMTRDWVEVEPERVCKECKRRVEAGRG